MTDYNELRRLAEAATPGPWRWSNTNAAVYLMGDRSRCVMAFSRMGMNRAQPEFRNAEGLMEKAGKKNLNSYFDAALIVSMRNALPALLDDLDALRDRAEKAEAIIELVKARHVRDESGDCWADGGPHPCPTMQALEGGDHE